MRKQHETGWETMTVAASALFMTVCLTIAGSVSQDGIRVHGEPVAERETQAETEAETETEKEILLLSTEDEAILKQIAMAEAEGETIEGKALVMRVVLNRTEDEQFPDTVEDVVFEEDQFSTVEIGGRYWTVAPDEGCETALAAIENGWDESDGALYFDAVGSETWQGATREYLYTCGGHNFYR